MFLLIFPSSLLAGLINRQVGFVRKDIWETLCINLFELFHHVLSEIIIVIFGNPLEYR